MPKHTIEELKLMPSKELRNLFRQGKIDPLQNSNGYTLLHAISEMVLKQKEFLPELLKLGANVNAQDMRTKYHNTPLHILIVNELTDSAILFIEEANRHQKTIDFDIHDSEGKTPLILAVKTHQFRMAHYLLQMKTEGANLNVNLTDQNGMSALHYACTYGSLALVKALISARANLDTMNDIRRKPIDYCNADSKVVAEFLKSVSIDPLRDERALWNNVKDKNGQDLIGFKSRQVYPVPAIKTRQIRKLIEGILDNDGIFDTTALAENIVQPLSSYEDNTFILQEIDGFTGRTLMQTCLDGQRETRDWLVTQGAAFDWLIRYFSSQENSEELPSLLNQSNIRQFINQPGQPSGKTALHNAVGKGHIHNCVLLLEAGANPNLSDKDKNTALHLAVFQKRADIAILLISKGAVLSIKNGQNLTVDELLEQPIYQEVKEQIELQQSINKVANLSFS